MKKIYFTSLLSFVCLSLLIGFLGSQLSGPETFSLTYSELNKPSFSPPSWVFAPVWTILYILMGIAGYLIWKAKEKNTLVLFFSQLALNLIWPIIFFGLNQYLWAFVEIIILWIFTFLTIKECFRFSKTAFYLLLPYILWLTFASILNFSIIIIN
jgi:tryptophan-rich sensory protein